jgi:hypothetical protein
VLTVVEHQQRPAIGEVGEQAGADRAVGVGAIERHAEGVGDGESDFRGGL